MADFRVRPVRSPAQIAGLGQKGMRTRVIAHLRVLVQADVHLEFSHGETRHNAMDAAEFAHWR